MQNTGNHLNHNRGNQDEKGQAGEEQHQSEQNSTPPQQSSYVRSTRREKKIKLERDESVGTRRNSEPAETTLENVELARKVSPSSSAPAGSAGGSSGKKSKRGKKSTRVDMNAKLERSRQSARECRARKKLRYQYLEDLVNKREKAVFSLQKELDSYKDWCKQVDDGANPKEAFGQKVRFS
ncbi:uncharacterized protein LOC107370158 [Tetranychus urticae]|uniref:BZIP domain-containing protein n=1 Tax=Tetranychus urticae TaxID=32264 RepID=T1JR43_TETUR|nr:uncharacterized protein LOC107370158 [Tetranychus urticae]